MIKGKWKPDVKKRKKIRTTLDLLFDTSDAGEERERGMVKARRLMEQFEIDPEHPDAWQDLALALVQGFSPMKPDMDFKLVMMVELLRQRDRMKIREACQHIVFVGAIDGDPDKLKQRYKDLKKDRRWETLLKTWRENGTLEASYGRLPGPGN
jgi:hypothetical protein